MWSGLVHAYADLLESSSTLWSFLELAGAAPAAALAAILMACAFHNSKRSHARTRRLLEHAKRTGKAADIIDASDSIAQVRPVYGGLGLVALIAVMAIAVGHAVLHWQALGEIESRGSILTWRAYKGFVYAQGFALVAMLFAGTYWWQHSNLDLVRIRARPRSRR